MNATLADFRVLVADALEVAGADIRLTGSEETAVRYAWTTGIRAPDCAMDIRMTRLRERANRTATPTP